MEQVSEFKVASGRKVAGAIRSLVKCKGSEGSVLHKGLPVPVLLYGSETIICKEKERYKIRAV